MKRESCSGKNKQYTSLNRKCAVCGEQVEPYDICENCGWQDDDVQRTKPDLRGGSNKVESGKTLQRRVYGYNGTAIVDFDSNDHNSPKAHPTGAHKHIINTKRKNPHGKPLPLTEAELQMNKDFIKKGENYFDNQ